MEAEYITAQECAKRLSVTVYTLRAWRRQGWVPFIRLGQRVRFCWSDVVKAMAERTEVGRQNRDEARREDLAVVGLEHGNTAKDLALEQAEEERLLDESAGEV